MWESVLILLKALFQDGELTFTAAKKRKQRDRILQVGHRVEAHGCPDHLHRSGARHAGLQQLLRLARRLAPATAVPARLNCGRVGPYLFPPAAHAEKGAAGR